MNYTNNLFYYATSELSQDAFICWLLSFLREENKGTDATLERCAASFVRCFYPDFPDNGVINDINRQTDHIDVLVIIGEKHVIIEDKTFTGVHGDQINKYKNTLVKKDIPEKDIICVYYKTIEQPDPEPSVDYEFTREKLLALFRQYKSDNAIFRSYLEHLEYIDKEINSFKERPIDKWSNNAYRGFFSYLRPGVFERDKSWWGYVSNPSGGFMCLWWSVVGSADLEAAGLDDVVSSLYPQIENDKIAIKMVTTKNASKEDARNARQQLYLYFSDKLNGEFERPRFRNGTHMTIGYIPYDYSDHMERIEAVNSAIRALGADFTKK